MLCIPTSVTMPSIMQKPHAEQVGVVHCVLYRAPWCNRVERHAELAYMRYAMLFLMQHGLGWPAFDQFVAPFACVISYGDVSGHLKSCVP